MLPRTSVQSIIGSECQFAQEDIFVFVQEQIDADERKRSTDLTRKAYNPPLCLLGDQSLFQSQAGWMLLRQYLEIRIEPQ